MKRLFTFICLAVSLSLVLFVPQNDYQKELSDKILRFHVMANSNSTKDQTLKLEVRDCIAGYLSDKLKDCTTLDQARDVVKNELPAIQKTAQDYVRQQGYDYRVTADVGEQYFPVKAYGAMTFPRGYYEALTVRIGSGLGRNWWCVLFPNLCFTDAVTAYVPSDSERLLERELENDTYEALYEGENVQLRFKLGEILSALFSE